MISTRHQSYRKICGRFLVDAITVYPKKYAHGFCFAVLCCGYTLTDFPISIRLTSLALWQSNDCPSASKATLMNMDKYFMWIHYERLHNHNKAKHNTTVCIFLGMGFWCRDSSKNIKTDTIRIVLVMGSANERQRYIVTLCPIGCAREQNYPCTIVMVSVLSAGDVWRICYMWRGGFTK